MAFGCHIKIFRIKDDFIFELVSIAGTAAARFGYARALFQIPCQRLGFVVIRRDIVVFEAFIYIPVQNVGAHRIGDPPCFGTQQNTINNILELLVKAIAIVRFVSVTKPI